jgi:hypothetical protein
MTRGKGLAILANAAMRQGFLLTYVPGEFLVTSERAFDEDSVTVARTGDEDKCAQRYAAVRMADGSWRYSTDGRNE